MIVSSTHNYELKQTEGGWIVEAPMVFAAQGVRATWQEALDYARAAYKASRGVHFYCDFEMQVLYGLQNRID